MAENKSDMYNDRVGCILVLRVTPNAGAADANAQSDLKRSAERIGDSGDESGATCSDVDAEMECL